jgi:hypothetical protein
MIKDALNRTIKKLIDSGGEPWEYDSHDIQKLVNWIESKMKQGQTLPIDSVIVSDFCSCDGVQDLHAMTGECRKCGKECDY